MRPVPAAARLALIFLVVLGALAAATVALAQSTDAEQQLADRYAPIMMLKTNDALPCGKGGEQYLPAPVEIILGNPDVQLIRVRPGQKSEVVRSGATAQDLVGLESFYYLNQPGVPYRPGCRYARDSERLTKGREPVVYAHVSAEPGRRGIALQYWFYYWFNRFNDLHESDWEMLQLAFDGATTPEEALARSGPTRIALAQHGGGETADWDDSKVEKEGAHPVVYVAAGSHASQYESALYLGRGRQGAGLGCDDTREPSYSLRPTPIVVPTIPSATSEHAWLLYPGHWGQPAKGFSNGVTGPSQKGQWDRPFTWMENLRDSTPKMPVSQAAGVTVTNFFCGAIIFVADIANFVGNRTWLVVLTFIGLLALIVIPIWRTRWRPATVEPLRQERAAGQLLRAAGVIYARYALTLLALVLVVVAFAFAVTRLTQFLDDHTGVDFNLNLAEPGIDSLSGALFLAPAYPLVLLFIGAPFVAVMRRIEAGEQAVPWTALREVIPLIPRLLIADVLAFGAIGLLIASVIGIPYAIKKAVDWTFAGQEIVFGGLEPREVRHSRSRWRRFRFALSRARQALAASSRNVRGRWWNVAAVNLSLFLLGSVVGPVIGAVLIIFTDAPLWTVNLAGLVTFGLLLPFMIVTLTLMYLDPRGESVPEAGSWRQRFRRRRRVQQTPAEAGA